MITALVLVGPDPRAFAQTVSALVAGVAEGVVGDAVALLPEGVAADAEALEIVTAVADAAGAELVRLAPGDDPWRIGATHARRDWLLCLEAGDIPVDGWARALERFLAGHDPAAPPIGRLARSGGGLAGLLARVAPGPRGPRAGDLVHVSHVKDGARPRVVKLEARLTRAG